MRKFVAMSMAVLVSAQVCAQGFSALVGGAGYEQVRDIATDCEGNIYITGGTSSPDFPSTLRAKLNTGGEKIMDAFVMKFSPEGKLIWSTLLGGPEYDRAYAIEISSNCEIYIAGRAGAGLPVTSCAFQRKFGGDNDANNLYGKQDGFIAKFSRNGDLLWCSYFGGNDRGFIRDIALDSSGNVFVVETETRGANPYVGKDAFQPMNKGGYDAVIAKISGDGKSVLWASYLGGGKDDMFGPSVKVDARGRPVVIGTVTSADMPVTPGCYDMGLDGKTDIYIARMSANGRELELGTYLGGSGVDGTETHNLALDKDDNIVVAATTSSRDLPLRGYQLKYGGDGGRATGLMTNYPHDGFIVKMSPDGKTVLAGTYLGGSAGEGIEGVGVDAKGNVHVSGATFSTDIAGEAKASKHTGGADAFVATFSPDLSELLFFRFIGSRSTDYGRALHVDAEGNKYMAGETSSESFPADNTAFGKYNGGPLDGFFSVFKTAKKIVRKKCADTEQQNCD